MLVVLFDFFGVIAPPVYSPIIKKYIAPEEQDEWIQMLAETDLGNLTESAFATLLAKKVRISQADLLAHDTNSKLNIALIAYITQTLKPTYKVGLLSNSSRTLIERVAGDTLALFQPCIISSDVKVIKPCNTIYVEAIKQCRVSADEIVFVDDNLKNVVAAEEAGLQGIHYTNLESFKNDIRPHLGECS